MQGEKGSLRDLQRYHRGTDGSKRRLIGNQSLIPEDDVIDGRRLIGNQSLIPEDDVIDGSNEAASSKNVSANLAKVTKTNLASKSPKLSHKGKRSDKDFIAEEDYLEKGKRNMCV